MSEVKVLLLNYSYYTRLLTQTNKETKKLNLDLHRRGPCHRYKQEETKDAFLEPGAQANSPPAIGWAPCSLAFFLCLLFCLFVCLFIFLFLADLQLVAVLLTLPPKC